MSKELVVQEQAEVQPSRVIHVWNQKNRSSQEVHTAATTWGEFKRELSPEIDFKNLRGVVRHNRNILEVDDALLPEESFSMFLFPRKVKSGMRTKEEYMKTFNREALREQARKRNLPSGGSKEKVAEHLANADKAEHEGKPIVTKPPVVTESAKKAKKASKSKAVAPVSKENGAAVATTNGFPATIESARVTTEMSLRINSIEALQSLFDAQFPGMKVVEVDAVIALKATLELGVPVAAPSASKEKKAAAYDAKAPKEEKLPPSRSETKKKKVAHEVPDEKTMSSEASNWAKDFL